MFEACQPLVGSRDCTHTLSADSFLFSQDCIFLDLSVDDVFGSVTCSCRLCRSACTLACFSMPGAHLCLRAYRCTHPYARKSTHAHAITYAHAITHAHVTRVHDRGRKLSHFRCMTSFFGCALAQIICVLLSSSSFVIWFTDVSAQSRSSSVLYLTMYLQRCFHAVLCALV